MAQPPPLPIDNRRDQMFPTLEPDELGRLRRFGTPRSYGAGEAVEKIGETGQGLILIVSGEVVITQRDGLGHHKAVVTHGPGAFMGELAQLSGRPSLVDGYAEGPVDAVVIPPQQLRALLIAEAELGERIMRALILRRVNLLRSPGSGPIVVGPTGHASVLRLQAFLGRNGHPFQTLDPENDAEARALVERFHIAPADLPITLCPNGTLLRNPSEDELAWCLGMVGAIDPSVLYDVAIVGAGPAGLAAAVYAASEGLSVIALDCHAFGGQAGASARIENYLGFPTGITGLALMARAYNQALKFGAEMAIPDEACALTSEPDGFRLSLSRNETVRARTVVIATGARYRRPKIAGIEAFEGSSVHYWASPLEARLCAGQEVALVGGGNSAGQAVVYLAGQTRKVWMLIRGSSLKASMSSYLIERIAGLPNVELVTDTEITDIEGEAGRCGQSIGGTHARERRRKPLAHLFLFIGADPNTDWLAGSGLALDPKGFLRTGPEISATTRPMETSLPGVFAIGDVRCGSTKRVAAAVGEGAQVVAAVHAYLADTGSVAAT